MVISDWYLADNYHDDSGEGAAFYSAGLSRGCGGNGLWAADRLWTSRNFINSRVLANGPIRVIFELDYAPFEVNGISVSEVKRISLDAGSQLDRFQSTYKQFTRPRQAQPLTCGIGIKKVTDAGFFSNPEGGWMAVWEKVAKNSGMQGVAVVAEPKSFVKNTEDKLNNLLLARCDADNAISYWAGFAWDKVGQITSAEAWKKYVEEFAQGLSSPVEISISAK